MSSSTSAAACAVSDCDPVATVVSACPIVPNASGASSVLAQLVKKVHVMEAERSEMTAALASISQQLTELKAAAPAPRTRKPKAASGGASASGGAGDDSSTTSGATRKSATSDIPLLTWDDLVQLYRENEELPDLDKEELFKKTKNLQVFYRYLCGLAIPEEVMGVPSGWKTGKTYSTPNAGTIEAIKERTAQLFAARKEADWNGTAVGVFKLPKDKD
jgi:hypothetical protein